MTMPKAGKEEKELLESFEKGEWRSVKRKDAESKRYREYARSTFQKDRRVSIRISWFSRSFIPFLLLFSPVASRPLRTGYPGAVQGCMNLNFSKEEWPTITLQYCFIVI
jgi:hypothetical protein